ncbi:alpha/beta hydrolase [Brevundimonas sp. SORGH_AS_0993]|uniref:alpha/beta hydrolase n=1 Tax=Brevundimonas sp. SORGH_AS_0993 TaxID=3041794 RepID=UPI002788F2EC|nr:alpha/beta hydrolase-fold protein [Brevundimonas sp. SORGH_AS_0993]MDQ1154628.1 putative alpha/beta superfamily hydrolase [Brevundimonas sp. SORGH_AS_0993]
MTDDVLSAWTPWTAPGWRVRALAGPEGRRLDLMLAAPQGTAPSGGWPLLFALDGGRFFAALAGAAEALSHRTEKTGVVPMVVAALVHRPDQGPLADQRARDFTRSPGPEAAAPSGGAGALRDLLAEAVLPMLAGAALIDPARTTLFGHSLGGLFVLETLRSDPALFARWVAISPSLWWTTPPADIAAPSLMVGCGEAETGRDMRGRITAWVAEKPDGAVFRQVSGADHGSAPFALIPDILRHASGGPAQRPETAP